MNAPAGFKNRSLDALFFRNFSAYIELFLIHIALLLLIKGIKMGLIKYGKVKYKIFLPVSTKVSNKIQDEKAVLVNM